MVRNNFALRGNRSRPLRQPSVAPTSLNWFERTLLGIIVACMICIAVSLCADAAFDPARDAKTALEDLADDYYIEYLYPYVLGNQINNPAPVLSEYQKIGLPIVRLRQLLTYDKTKTTSYLQKISNEYVKCDTNMTAVRFFPKEPYGPRDYDITFQLSCQGPAVRSSDWFVENTPSLNN